MIIRAMRLVIIILTLICFSSFGCSAKKDKEEQKVEIEKKEAADTVNIDNSKGEPKIEDSHTVAVENLEPKEIVEPKLETKDKNGDGKPDVWLYYNEKKEHVRSEADRDYDGRPDYWRYLKDGKVVKEEGDIDLDGAIDMWVFYEEGKKVKAERDTNKDTKPDMFVYYEADKMAGLEKDTDFDGKIDEVVGKIPSK